MTAAPGRAAPFARRALALLARYRREAALGVAAAVLGVAAGVWLQRGEAPPPASAPATLAQAPGGGPAAGRVAIGWRGRDGALYRAGVPLPAYRTFLAGDRAAADADTARLAAQARTRIRAALVPAFAEVSARVPAFGAWTFDWWTSWILLGRVIGWMWEDVRHGIVLAMPERVQIKLVAEVERRFDELVLQPDALEPELAQRLQQALAASAAELETLCRAHEDGVRAFVRANAGQVERSDGPGRWTPLDAAQAAEALALACTGEDAAEQAALRSELAKLRAAGQINDPVDEVIVRLARPFATKLISYVILPAIVAALIGAVLLPLLGILPNVLSGAIVGLLTGALGAGIIGFSASASVDWLLTRADEMRNRAGFEVQVRRAVTARRDALETAVATLHAQAIANRLRPFAEGP